MLNLRQRIAREEGFTLIELLVVLIIIGILLSIAIPSYLGFQKKAQQTAAMSDVRSAVPDAEAYYSDNNSYTSMTASTLRTNYDSGMLVVGVNGVTDGIKSAIPSASNNQRYCISAVVGGHWAHIAGPGGQVSSDTTASVDPCSGF
jgi:prepilin-type N-terminal cleavage/methylation domain-containing protein